MPGDEQDAAWQLLTKSGWWPNRKVQPDECFVTAARRFVGSTESVLNAIGQIWGLRLMNRETYQTLICDCDFPFSREEQAYLADYERYVGATLAPCAWDLDYCVYVTEQCQFYGAGEGEVGVCCTDR